MLAPPSAAALTDAGLLLIVVAGGVAIIAFLIFVLREALDRPVEVPRELPPPHDLSPLDDDPAPQDRRSARETEPPITGG
jgi:hypothetical protein